LEILRGWGGDVATAMGECEMRVSTEKLGRNGLNLFRKPCWNLVDFVELEMALNTFVVDTQREANFFKLLLKVYPNLKLFRG
jgi:hypothetical protein